LTSLATVACGRPIARPIALKLSPHAKPRETSSRSPNDRHRSARLRGAGRTPPDPATHAVTLSLAIPTSRAIACNEYPSTHNSHTRSRRHSGHRPITTTFRSAGSQPGPPDDQAVHQPLETTVRSGHEFDAGAWPRATAFGQHRSRALARDLAHPRCGWDRADRRLRGWRDGVRTRVLHRQPRRAWPRCNKAREGRPVTSRGLSLHA
jgi:hypothetical protein